MFQRPQRVILQDWFSLLVPREWTYEEHEGVTSIHDPKNDAWSINISLFRREGEPDEAELRRQSRRFAENLGAELKDEAIGATRVGGSPASYFECLDDEGDHWRAWHVGGPGRLVLLTFNCPKSTAERERRMIDRIIKSFQWESPEGQGAQPGPRNGNGVH